jgi:hypothetical protein
MVDANTTRATSKKIKDSAATKNRTDDVSIARSLIPNPGSTTPSLEDQALGGSSSTQALSGSNPALGGNPLNPANSGVTIGQDARSGKCFFPTYVVTFRSD